MQTTNTINRIYTCKGSNHPTTHVRIDYRVIINWSDEDASGASYPISSEFQSLDGSIVYVPWNVDNKRCDSCGYGMESVDVIAIHNPEGKCDFRCMNAHGPLCVCSCGGPNHGKGWIK